MKIKWVFIISSFLLFVAFIWAYLDVTGSQLKLETCVPFNTDVSKDGGEATVTWTTEGKCTGYIRYGTDPEELDYVSVTEEIQSKNHSVKIERKEDVDYFIVVISDENVYGVEGKPISLMAD